MLIKICSQTIKIDKYSISNKNWHMIYLISGKLRVTVSDSVYELPSGGVALISPESFYFVADDIAHYAAFEFEADNCEKILKGNRIFNLSSAQAELMNTLTAAQDLIQKTTALQLLLILSNENTDDISPVADEKNRLYKKAVRLMQRYIASGLSVDELAYMLDISLSNLKRIFAKFSGIGVHEYLLMLKINKAKELLLKGNSVTRTSELLRFSSQAYFSSAFKREMGVSAKSFSMGKTETAYNFKPKNRKKGERPVTASPRELPDYLL